MGGCSFPERRPLVLSVGDIRHHKLCSHIVVGLQFRVGHAPEIPIEHGTGDDLNFLVCADVAFVISGAAAPGRRGTGGS